MLGTTPTLGVHTVLGTTPTMLGTTPTLGVHTVLGTTPTMLGTTPTLGVHTVIIVKGSTLYPAHSVTQVDH